MYLMRYRERAKTTPYQPGLNDARSSPCHKIMPAALEPPLRGQVTGDKF